MRLRFDKTETTYSNMNVITTTPEEVVVNFGISIAPPGAGREVQVEVPARVIMSYAAAKRLALNLSNVIQRYENAHGEVKVRADAPAPRARAELKIRFERPSPRSED